MMSVITHTQYVTPAYSLPTPHSQDKESPQVLYTRLLTPPMNFQIKQTLIQIPSSCSSDLAQSCGICFRPWIRDRSAPGGGPWRRQSTTREHQHGGAFTKSPLRLITAIHNGDTKSCSQFSKQIGGEVQYRSRSPTVHLGATQPLHNILRH